MDRLRVVSPVDGREVASIERAGEAGVARALAAARAGQQVWRAVPLAERCTALERAVDAFVARRDEIALEITLQMGRPIRSSPGEVSGFEERARAMLALAPAALHDVDPGEKPGFLRFVRRDPLGVVLTVAPWNYPYLTAVNSVVPALAAGNAVILRHSSKTPLCAERFAEAFREAGLPGGVFQVIHCGHALVDRMIRSPEVDFVAFTGSVAGGRAVQRAASERFMGTGLELGGKDPAYVRADAAVAESALALVDGAFFNSGQSCCGIERIYVRHDVFDTFLNAFLAEVDGYRLGNPLDPETTLGPLVQASAADFVRGQIDDACAAGATAHVEAARFAADAAGTSYLAPQVLTGVDHGMRVMTEETFGPLVGIMSVSGDEEAVRLMNDSDYGLTASVWTGDVDVALALGERVDTGTWFMNRCDYLDPALAWTGVKDSGRGCTLSRVGYEWLTRPKSYHLRVAFP